MRLYAPCRNHYITQGPPNPACLGRGIEKNNRLFIVQLTVRQVEEALEGVFNKLCRVQVGNLFFAEFLLFPLPYAAGAYIGLRLSGLGFGVLFSERYLQYQIPRIPTALHPKPYIPSPEPCSGSHSFREAPTRPCGPEQPTKCERNAKHRKAATLICRF